MAGRSSPNAGLRIRRERGYAMLALLLMASLLMIGAAAVAPSIALEIRRDRETERARGQFGVEIKVKFHAVRRAIPGSAPHGFRRGET